MSCFDDEGYSDLIVEDARREGNAFVVKFRHCRQDEEPQPKTWPEVFYYLMEAESYPGCLLRIKSVKEMFSLDPPDFILNDYKRVLDLTQGCDEIHFYSLDK